MSLQTKEKQAVQTPTEVVEILKQGNRRFTAQNRQQYNYKQQVEETAKGQFPHSVILSCIDSRMPTEIIFDQGIGDLFNIRVAGNIVNEDVLGSMEFACAVSGAKLIVVLGHTSCGAVSGACDSVRLGNLTHLLDKIKPALDAVQTPEGTNRSSKNRGFVNEVAHMNVKLTIENIKTQSPIINSLYEKGDIDIVGAMYDVRTGKVTFE